MPELMIKIGDNGPDPQYRDGDVVEAFNQRRIRCVHAQLICDCGMRETGFNRDGLRDLNALCRLAWYEIVSEFRFERISQKEVDRVRLADLRRDRLSQTPNASGEYIDVAAFLGRRTGHARHRIFGTAGAEVWYGGADLSNAKMDAVWSEIESRTRELEINYPFWPATQTEKQQFLLLRTDDFSENRTSELISPEVDTRNPIRPMLTKKRRNRVDWQTLGLPVSDSAVNDKNTAIDLRPVREDSESVIVIRK